MSCDSSSFVNSNEDLLIGISIKLQYTPEKRRYSNFDLLVTLSHSLIIESLKFATVDLTGRIRRRVTMLPMFTLHFSDALEDIFEKRLPYPKQRASSQAELARRLRRSPY